LNLEDIVLAYMGQDRRGDSEVPAPEVHS